MRKDSRVDDGLVSTLANGVLEAVIYDRVQVAGPLLKH